MRKNQIEKKQIEIGLKSGTIIYFPLSEDVEDQRDVIESILFTDFNYINLCDFVNSEKPYYVRKDCIEYITVNDESNKKILNEVVDG